ncbi:TolC family protein [Hydrogenophaga pseudoflava]|uniref:TolC family protein n=1 Tax=Hydrogenophaga pseudoflava TaxID=47421 RepID=UPI0027E524AB|nr:TolC family protein [Hydrogenophaga pseudoflava]MDQ7744960.1 TolC family protein [Hydrogenophaga pseudoflava]
MASRNNKLIPALRTGLIVSAVLGLTACAQLTPPALTDADVASTSQADRSAMARDVEPIMSPLTLEEAMARALKYNLDRRAKLMEEAVALRQLDLTRYDMLPTLAARLSAQSRSNDRISQSLDPETGDISSNGFISQDRSHHMSDLGVTASLLDFGMGYYNARQQTNRVYIAAEKRRRAMHLLMQDVRIAYWRAASAQKLRDDVAATIRAAEEALADSRKLEQERTRNPVDALRYQRQLLENLRLLESINQELLSAQVDLASLINAPLNQPIPIAESALADTATRVVSVPVEQLETVALRQNADLREQHYNARVAQEETRKAMLRMFPNLSFNYGFNYDSDKYLINNHWREAGLQLSFNFMNLLTGPAQVKLAEAGVKLADQRRMATQMAVLTQLHLVRLQFLNARSQFARAEEVYATDRRISELMRTREAVQASSKLERVSNDTAAILSLLRRYQALAQVQAAENRLLAQLGLEPRIGRTDELSLQALTEQIKGQTGFDPLWLRMSSDLPRTAP